MSFWGNIINNMEEAAKSDDITIIHKGKIVANGSPTQLKERYAYDVLKMELNNGTRLKERLESTTDALPIIDAYRENIAHFEVISGTLDDVFINLTEEIENDN